MASEPVDEGLRRRGRPRRGSEARTTAEQRQLIARWFARRLPRGWFAGPPEVLVDDDEILVVGLLPAPRAQSSKPEEQGASSEGAQIAAFREATREERMRIAEEARGAFGRRVSWGARCESTSLAFTLASVPVMTRLGIRERQVLDTLIDAGVARSRSEALAWCVRLVGKNEGVWISELRSALEHVEAVRDRGPESAPPES